MPTAEEMIEGRDQVRQWYKQKLIAAHGNGNMTLIMRVLELTPYETMREEYVKETGAYSGPYSAK